MGYSPGRISHQPHTKGAKDSRHHQLGCGPLALGKRSIRLLALLGSSPRAVSGPVVAADLVELLPADYARILRIPMIRQALETLFNSAASSSMESLRHAALSFAVMSCSRSTRMSWQIHPKPDQERHGHTRPPQTLWSQYMKVKRSCLSECLCRRCR